MKNVLIAGLFIFAGAIAEAEEVLTLNNFLEAVRNRNDDYRAAAEAEDAAKLYSSESSIVYSPMFLSSGQYKDDAQESPMPMFRYEKQLHTDYMIGIGQQTPIGLQGKFYYTLSKSEWRGLTPTVGPFSDARPTLELTQSLWRNDFGREVRAQVNAAKATARATQHEKSYARQQQLVLAEQSYWRLVLARQNLELAKENLARAERIFGWAKRRVQLSLADRSDFLQATTALQGRKLELKIAQDETRVAAVAFNNSRGQASEQVSEKLQPLSKELIDGLRVSERKKEREDTLAAEQNLIAMKSKAVVDREKNQPKLEVFGTYAYNTRRLTNNQDAIEDSFEGNRPTKAVGVRFETPLFLGDLSDTQAGYAKQAKAAELALDRRKFLAEQDWRDLNLKFTEAKERLALADELEKAQLEKLNHERGRHEKGRSTLFQVLTYESDYSSAQATRLKALNDLLQIAASMKLYGVY